MTEASTDTPDVIIFPPLIPISVLVVGVVLNLLIPLGLLAHVLLLGRIVVGTIAFVVGIGMVIGANRIFRRIGTNVNPSQPTAALATTGVLPIPHDEENCYEIQIKLLQASLARPSGRSSLCAGIMSKSLQGTPAVHRRTDRSL